MLFLMLGPKMSQTGHHSPSDLILLNLSLYLNMSKSGGFLSSSLMSSDLLLIMSKSLFW